MRGSDRWIDLLEQRCLLTSTALDASFGPAGRRSVDVDARSLRSAIFIEEQSDSKILTLAGATRRGESHALVMARLNPDGSADATFGKAGVLEKRLPFIPTTAAAESDGQIVVAGQVGLEIRIASVHRDGTRDSSFGQAGLAAIGYGDDVTQVKLRSLLVGPDDQVIVVSSVQLGDPPTDGEFALTHLSAHGQMGSNSTLISHRDEFIDVAAATVQSDGKILLAGRDGQSAFVARINPDGTPDDSFGAQGFTIFPRRDRRDVASAVTIQSDGKILVGLEFRVARLTAAGQMDPDFAGGHIVDIATFLDFPQQIEVDSSGRIVLSCESHLVRITADGALDNTFGRAGISQASDTAGDEFVGMNGAFAIRANDQILVSGTVVVPGNAISVARVGLRPDIELTADGTLIVTGTGSTTVNIGRDGDEVVVVAGGKRAMYPRDQVKRIDIDAGEDFGDINVHIAIPAAMVIGGQFDTIKGGNKSDLIIASDGRIQCGGGNDTVQAGSADNTILGGDGDDAISVANGEDMVDGGDGNDSIVTGDGDGTIVGSAGNDFVETGEGDNSIVGGDGNDTILSTGQDTIDAGDGDDFVKTFSPASGGPGNDTLVGLGGSFELHGGDGNDSIRGGLGPDSLFGEAGNDTLRGGDGNDLLSGGGGKDKLFGQQGNDRLYGGANNDQLDGGPGKDRLTGGSGADKLLSRSGNDTLFADDSVSDTVSGGSGADSAKVDDLIDVVDGVESLL